jgi:metal-responsive CopG/Arc/MetJ family transcriptional regulator
VPQQLTRVFLLAIIKKMEKDRVTLKIPRQLYEKLKTVIEGSGFRSVNEFVVYVMRDLISLRKDEAEKDLSKDEIEAIKQRLKNLGYF